MIYDWPIGDLPGLNKSEQTVLEELGITTTNQLLTAVPDSERKMKLAIGLGTKIQYVNKLVALADLSRLPGIGCQYNGLLLHIGIISIKQLSQMTAQKVQPQLLKLHVATLQRRDLCPDLAQVQGWIIQARALIDNNY
jgi:predicted flap endonuclease-1-like 5' DNA nuclease